MTLNVPHSEEAVAQANGIEITYDTFGDPQAKPMLLIMGLGAQMIAWEEDFCAQLAEQGHWVIRFDNRDIGLSTKFTEAGAPDLTALMMASMQGQPVSSAYLLSDMALDAVGLLDALDIKAAHVVGVSMGGMIAQMMAVNHPDRTLTLTSIMSSTGDPDLPPPTQEAAMVLGTPAPTDREGYIEETVKAWRVLSGPVFPYPEEVIRNRAAKTFDRGLSPAGFARQLAAIFASGSRKEALKSVTTSTLVIHGDADPLVPVEAGKDTANTVPGAKLLIVEGMGHSLPVEAWPQLIGAITEHAA